jgi:hypothetical protein
MYGTRRETALVKKNNFSCLRSEGIGESQQLESELPLFSDDKISP